MNRYLAIFLLCLGLNASAQISIILHPLQPTQMKASDMFSADVISTDNKTNRLYFVGTIINRQNGQRIVAARSAAVDIAPGVRQLSESLLMPEYTFLSSATAQSGNLPYGNYEVCLRAYEVSGIEESATACDEVEVMPLSPPLLLSPENESSVSDEYPLLIWLPPMPIGKEQVLYDLKLTEILPNQTPYDAIQRNFAIMEKQSISGTSLQYPANAIRLEVGKRYAWQVKAYTGAHKPLGETEVWWFMIEKEIPETREIVVSENYIIPDLTRDNSIVYIGKVLNVYIDEYPEDITFRFSILDSKNKPVNTSDTRVTKTHKGRYSIALDGGTKLKNGGYYTFMASMPDGTKRYIFFRHIQK
jgi:hypothetical protein